MCQSHPAAPTDIPPGPCLSSRCSVRTCTLKTQRVDSGEHRPSYIKVISKIPFTHAFETVQKESKTNKKNKKKQKTKHRAPIQRVVIYSSRYNIQGAFFFLFFFLMGLPLRTDLQQSVTRPLVSCSAASRDTPDGRD